MSAFIIHSLNRQAGRGIITFVNSINGLFLIVFISCHNINIFDEALLFALCLIGSGGVSCAPKLVYSSALLLYDFNQIRKNEEQQTYLGFPDFPSIVYLYIYWPEVLHFSPSHCP